MSSSEEGAGDAAKAGAHGDAAIREPGEGPSHDPPAWFDELSSALVYADHLVLSGNVRDVYPVPRGGDVGFPDIFGALRALLGRRHVENILVHDPASGFRLIGEACPQRDAAMQEAGIALGEEAASLSELAEIHERISGDRELSVAMVFDYATHLRGRTPEELERFFIRIDKASRSALAREGRGAPRNPTIWIVDHPADLPDWFVVGNDHLREVQVEFPDIEDRFLFACRLVEETDLADPGDLAELDRHVQQFALETEGETLAAMRAIARIAQEEGLPFRRISEAIRIHRTGSRRNPWASSVLRARVRDAREALESRIKGQPHAIEKTLDILARSIMGLSGSQSGPRHKKPRGVLFFAGPTGVGKTEMAKAVTELLFGDDAACHRFDMSEFMDEDSIARLIGAPPGHPGHERGGELVNAANRRPFSVFLFDEIEKAHPRILDMFLQVLDDGRLTDSRGATAHFSQALIIFTSNIGVMQGSGSSATNMGMNVLPSDSYEQLDAKITRAVQDHFRMKLRRPELVSRIGQNIVVFDFLSPESATQIFGALLGRVLETVRYQLGIALTIEDGAYRDLKMLCIHDHFDGGRGIGNRIETHFINPLARALFERGAHSSLRVTDIVTKDGKTVLVLDDDGAAADDRDASGADGSSLRRPATPRRVGREEVARLRVPASRERPPRSA